MALGSAIEAWQAELGPAGVVTDPDLLASHVIDWTGRWRGHSPAVLRPVSTEQVATIVRIARRHGVPLIPQGGNTGLVGGATPLGGEVVVDLRRLDALEPVDRESRQVTVGAGVRLADLQAHVAPYGLTPPVDLGARDTATLGGMVATNAGGIHVVRYGSMRAHVVGIEAVLGTGEVVAANLAGLIKDNTGYDLPGLLCGSEGTLGLVTTVRLGLVDSPRARVVALVGFATVRAVEALPVLRRCADLHAVELMIADGIDLVSTHVDEAFPIQPVPACALLVEIAGHEPLAALGAVLAELRVEATAVVAEDPQAQRRFWRWRDAHPEAAAALGVVHKADVTVPLGRLATWVDDVVPAVAAAVGTCVTLVYGHLADGNLHVNVVGPDADDDRAADAVLSLVLAAGGSVSAEHGIGRAKRGWLERQRGAAAVSAMRAIKGALDPDGILNPGVLLP